MFSIFSSSNISSVAAYHFPVPAKHEHSFECDGLGLEMWAKPRYTVHTLDRIKIQNIICIALRRFYYMHGGGVLWMCAILRQWHNNEHRNDLIRWRKGGGQSSGLLSSSQQQCGIARWLCVDCGGFSLYSCIEIMALHSTLYSTLHRRSLYTFFKLCLRKTSYKYFN